MPKFQDAVPPQSELEKFLIHKELGKFSAQKDNSKPSIHLSMDTIEEKAVKVAQQGFPLTSFQVALFTFLHEYEHSRQLQSGQVTATELNDPQFTHTDKCKQLEKHADEAAVSFIQANKIAFNPFSLQILANEVPPIFKVGEIVQLQKIAEIVDTVYFVDKFFCGKSHKEAQESVDMGEYKISIPEGTKAVINSINGTSISLIELSNLGKISAFDPLKGKEIANQVQVYSCTVDLGNLRKL